MTGERLGVWKPLALKTGHGMESLRFRSFPNFADEATMDPTTPFKHPPKNGCHAGG